jgi:transposase
MVRVGEDVSEKLDIVPAEFFVHRHVHGKWACKCCQLLVQEPVPAQIIDGGVPASGLLAHTLISRFVDHLPYYRQEAINARCGVHTPRSTLAQWCGRTGAALEPLYDVHKRFVLNVDVLHADETPVAMLDPGAGKTKKAYVWAYARGAFDPTPGVVYDFCLGRGAQYPIKFLGPPREGEAGWRGTLVRDEYGAYERPRREAAPGAHRRRVPGALSRAPFYVATREPSRDSAPRIAASSLHKVRLLRVTVGRRASPPWASMPWPWPDRCPPSSRTPASRRASSAGWS